MFEASGKFGVTFFHELLLVANLEFVQLFPHEFLPSIPKLQLEKIPKQKKLILRIAFLSSEFFEGKKTHAKKNIKIIQALCVNFFKCNFISCVFDM